jgi:hypothetical protein
MGRGGVRSDSRGRRERGGPGTTRSRAKGGAVTLAWARQCRVAHVVALRGEEIGEGKGVDRWAGATVSQFESIQTGQVIQTLFEFKF